MERTWHGGAFRTFDLGGFSLIETRVLEDVLRRSIELEQRMAEYDEKASAPSATGVDERNLDYQLLMAQQSLLAGLSDLDPGFSAAHEACRRYTMTSTERLYALYKAVGYVVRARIPGAIVETGVWRGGSMMLAAHALLRTGDTSRRLFLYDTYEGHPRPDSEYDVDLWGNRAIEDWRKSGVSDRSSNWARAPLEDVRENMRSTGYPPENVRLVKGMVEETALSDPPGRIALLRLDTDWYESTRVALEAFYPRLSDNGVLIVDDYGHYRGQREAVDRYFGSDEAPPLLTRIDYSCRLAIKPARRPNG